MCIGGSPDASKLMIDALFFGFVFAYMNDFKLPNYNQNKK
jgi:hypothetical protein